ncbi:MAG: hypothetical protein JWO36_5460 [Myxococcales bacterium]|nr:hypothetical protein [Myxococcales bacterium]
MATSSDFVFPDPGVPKIPIERLDDINSDKAARYVAEHRPFVVRVDWPALQWGPDYLRATAGTVPIRTWKKTGEEVEMPLSEFLTLVEDPVTHKRDYVVHNYPVIKLWDWWGKKREYEQLLRDVPLPGFINPDRISGMNVWVRNTGWFDNKSHCESNAAAAINLQVRGKKHVWLFPPEDAHLLGVEVPRESLMEPAYFANVQTVFRPSPEHPEFANVRCYETVLEPGDAIHIPTFWYHWFVHYNVFQMNLNCWFSTDTIQMSPVAGDWAYMNALSIALGDLGNLRERFAQLPVETQDLLTKISHLLVGDPRCTDSMMYRRLFAAREKQVLDPSMFTKKKT